MSFRERCLTAAPALVIAGLAIVQSARQWSAAPSAWRWLTVVSAVALALGITAVAAGKLRLAGSCVILMALLVPTWWTTLLILNFALFASAWPLLIAGARPDTQEDPPLMRH